MGKHAWKRPEEETTEDIRETTYWFRRRMGGKNSWDVVEKHAAVLGIQEGYLVRLGTVTGEKCDFVYDEPAACWRMTEHAVEQNTKQQVTVLALSMHERLDAVAGALPAIKMAMEQFAFGRLEQPGAAGMINTLAELASHVTEMQILAAKVANSVFVATHVKGTDPLVEVGEFGDFVHGDKELTQSR